MIHELSIYGYIAKSQYAATNANTSDHKPTYVSELEGIEKRCRELFQAGEALMSDLDEDEIEKCRWLYQYREKQKGGHGFWEDYLQELTVFGKRVIAPAFVGYLEELRDLRENLT